MRSSVAAFLVLLISIAAVADNAVAQTPNAGNQPNAVSLPDLATVATASRAAPLHNRVITALGGALLGAGAGFFASQVVRGDWDDQPGQGTDRPVWAAVGGSVGFALGFSFPVSGKGGGRPVTRLEPSPSQSISADQIHTAKARDAHEAVRLLRPQWLIQRGKHVFGETSDDAVRVYLDGNLLGDVRAMRQISATTIASIQFLDAGAATLRWGAGHSHGAILIIGN